MPVTELHTKEDFDKALAELPDGKLMVIDFTASWCGPCQTIKPKYKAMSDEFTNVLFYKVDVDVNDETAEAEGIQAMPTFKFYKKGVKIDKIQGGNESKLREMIKRFR